MGISLFIANGWAQQNGRQLYLELGQRTGAITYGDLFGGPEIDLVAAEDSASSGQILVLVNQGLCTSPSILTFAVLPDVRAIEIADLDGDGDNDIVKNTAIGCCGVDNHTSILYNDGTGNFDFEQRINENEEAYMIEPADWSGDNMLDWYFVDDQQDRYLTFAGLDGNGRATYTGATVTNSPNTEGFGGNVKIHDLDADGIMDVLIADVDTDLPGCDRRMTVLRGTGTLPNVSFSDPFNGAARTWLPTGVFDIDAIDIDKDGNLDLWLGTCTGNEIHMNTSGPGLFIGDFEDGTGRWSNCVGAGCPAP